jgi:colicin import membrane protein
LALRRREREVAKDHEHERVLQSLRDTEAEMKRKEEAAMAQRQVETERIAGTKELLASERKAKEAAAEAEKSRLENQRLISENVQKRKEEEAARQCALAQVMRDERAELDEQRR